ncbi:hypothetical protein CPT_Mydo_081 [Proteus phage Mydo]|uniref:Uncharacterized protein n=1 Tax=Proteus phage Mydo TaxID=2483610 RepID=A0A3G8F0S9_9CAUD|nr:hypothetical protein HWB97_gp081 [Proteus phage Mydo]AZF87656.1 hypothetical protein CPT_Mydo_081 [Proteus phage Mydo]
MFSPSGCFGAFAPSAVLDGQLRASTIFTDLYKISWARPIRFPVPRGLLRHDSYLPKLIIIKCDR